jgi:hypothetical protein
VITAKLKLNEAEKSFATANTPLYLIRKLRTDVSVSRLAARATAVQLFREMRIALRSTSDDFRSSVLPYVLLVALSLKSENKFIIKAATLPAPHHPWFRYCCDYLATTYRPISAQKLSSSRKLKTSRSVKNSGRTNTVLITGA